ncbi:MAG TPA: hypothetical protein VJA22_03635 [Patescibacteria group bacterium]|nr:hypothetical protein [Patescibacteria group bacterium]
MNVNGETIKNVLLNTRDAMFCHLAQRHREEEECDCPGRCVYSNEKDALCSWEFVGMFYYVQDPETLGFIDFLMSLDGVGRMMVYRFMHRDREVDIFDSAIEEYEECVSRNGGNEYGEV